MGSVFAIVGRAPMGLNPVDIFDGTDLLKSTVRMALQP